MKLVPTPDERDLAVMLRDLLTNECPTRLVRDLGEPGADRFPAALWKTLVSAGVLGLPFAEEYGGSGGTLDELGVFASEAGRALCPSVVASTLAFGLAVDRLGTSDQRSRHLTPLSAGQLRASVSLWNPSDAADVRPALTAVEAGDSDGKDPAVGPAVGTADVLVSGTVDFVPDADLADLLLVHTTLTADAAPSRVVGLIVDPAAPGVRIEPLTTIDGGSFWRVVLDQVRVAGDEVLDGPSGNGLREEDLRRVAHTITALQCLEMVGGAEAVLQRTVAHTVGRHQFGRPIASFQAAQHLVANMHIALQGARLSSRSAVFWLGQGRLATRETAVARMHATTACKQITLDAHQLHGGMGYVLETDLHLWSARARTLATLGGTADTAAAWLAKEVDHVRP